MNIRLIFLWAMLCVLQLAPRATYSSLTVEDKPSSGVSYNKIKLTLNKIVHQLENFKNILTKHPIKICNQTLGDLENSDTDWRSDLSYAFNDTVIIRCKEGFITPNQLRKQVAKCHLGNVWSSFQPCSKKVCTKFPSTKNAEKNLNVDELFDVGQTVTVKCEDGFSIIGNKAITEQEAECLPGNTWSKLIPCHAECTEMPILGNAQLMNQSSSAPYPVGTKLTFKCTNNFYLKGTNSSEQSTECLIGNMWSELKPCYDVCPSPFERTGTICMAFHTTRRSFNSAKSRCEGLKPDLNSRLAILETRQKQIDFRTYYRKNDAKFSRDSYEKYIDLHDKANEGTFVWGNGASFAPDILKWNSGEPNDVGGEDCVGVLEEVMMNDLPCSVSRESFCEIPL